MLYSSRAHSCGAKGAMRRVQLVAPPGGRPFTVRVQALFGRGDASKEDAKDKAFEKQQEMLAERRAQAAARQAAMEGRVSKSQQSTAKAQEAKRAPPKPRREPRLVVADEYEDERDSSAGNPLGALLNMFKRK